MQPHAAGVDGLHSQHPNMTVGLWRALPKLKWLLLAQLHLVSGIDSSPKATHFGLFVLHQTLCVTQTQSQHSQSVHQTGPLAHCVRHKVPLPGSHSILHHGHRAHPSRTGGGGDISPPVQSVPDDVHNESKSCRHHTHPCGQRWPLHGPVMTAGARRMHESSQQTHSTLLHSLTPLPLIEGHRGTTPTAKPASP